MLEKWLQNLIQKVFFWYLTCKLLENKSNQNNQSLVVRDTFVPNNIFVFQDNCMNFSVYTAGIHLSCM